MKSIRNIAFSALLALGAFTTVTYTACNPDECKDVTCSNNGTCVDGKCNCPSFYEGTTCQTEVRTKYYNTYKGNGTATGLTFTNWGLKFEARSTEAKNMALTILDDDGDAFTSVNVVLQSNTTFIVEQKTSGTEVITGTGTINETNASLTLNINDDGDITVVTFSNMIKQ